MGEDSLHDIWPLPFWRRRVTITSLGLLAVAVALLVGGTYTWRRWNYLWNYPYGWSHCCDMQLYFLLRSYADAHGGHFLADESTPEASLSSMYRNRFAPDCGYLLCGKRLSGDMVQTILDGGKLLDPDTCGWNYVEGLHDDDRGDLALFWDKEGLNHNGRRLREGGHLIWFLDTHTKYVPASDWQRFLEEQERLWMELKKQGREIRMSEAGRTPAGAKP